MRQPWFVSLLVLAAVLAGYAVAARPINAQAESFPFAVGDTVNFTMPDHGTQRGCQVEQVRGMFVRCAHADDTRVARGVSWVNVSALLRVEVVTDKR